MKVLKQGTSFMYWTCWTTVTCIYLSMASPLSEIRLTSAFQMPNSTRNISKNGFQSFGNGSYFIQKAAKTVIDPSDEAIINLPVLTADIIIPELQKGMQNTILSLRKSLSSIQVGRASPDLLSRVTVRAYGLATPISQLATISAVGMQSLSVEPYDTSLIKSMVRAIVESDLGLSPTVDGNTIFMDIPPMNEELRMRMCKKCKTIGEDCKVSIRNVRRCSMESTKKLKYTGAIGQDEQKRIETNIQHCTDEYIKQIIDLVNKKEEEVITM